MQGKLPLIVASVAGSLAIAIVAVDLQFGLEAQLQQPDGDGWESVASSTDEYYRGSGCAGPELRLHVENHRFVATQVPVLVTYWSLSQGRVTVLDETWDMARGEVRDHDFTIPADAFEAADGEKPPAGSISVDVQVRGQYFGVCVQEAA